MDRLTGADLPSSLVPFDPTVWRSGAGTRLLYILWHFLPPFSFLCFTPAPQADHSDGDDHCHDEQDEKDGSSDNNSRVRWKTKQDKTALIKSGMLSDNQPWITWRNYCLLEGVLLDFCTEVRVSWIYLIALDCADLHKVVAGGCVRANRCYKVWWDLKRLIFLVCGQKTNIQRK